MAAIALPRPDCSYFFRQLARAQRGVLVLDYDSAIARFGRLRPDRFPYPTVYDVLDSILSTTRTRVVIVSRRHMRDLLRVLGVVADRSIWYAENLQLVTLNNSFHSCTPHSLLSNLAALGPLAYVADSTAEPRDCGPDCTSVQPYFMLGEKTKWLGGAEGLIQFLIDWLRACGGEVC
jgi:hypothetical protein